MRLSLTFCLLVASTAIGDKTLPESCVIVLNDAIIRVAEILPLEAISQDLNAEKPFLKEDHESPLVHICAAKTSKKAALEYILKDIHDECGKDPTKFPLPNSYKEYKEYKRTQQQIGALEALCYRDIPNEKNPSGFVALNNPWILDAFHDAAWNLKPNIRNFQCTKGNRHVLGTINHVADLQNVVQFAKENCQLTFVEGLDSATGVPYPENQEKWEAMYKKSGGNMNKEISTWNARLGLTKLEWKGRFQKTEKELQSVKKELEEKKSDLEAARKEVKELKNGSRIEQIEDGHRKQMGYQNDRITRQHNEIRKLETERDVERQKYNKLLEEVKDNAFRSNGPKISATSTSLPAISGNVEGQKLLVKVRKERDDAPLNVQNCQRLLADAESRLGNAFSCNDPKNSATSTMIPAISGFLSLACLASQY